MVKKYFESVILSKNNGTYCSMRGKYAKTVDIWPCILDTSYYHAWFSDSNRSRLWELISPARETGFL